MKKVIFHLIVIIFLGIGITTKSHAALVTPSHSVLNFCQKYAMLSGIFNAYPNIMPTIGPLPGPPFAYVSIVPGLLAKTSVVMYVCDMLTNLETLSDKDGIFYLAEQFNDLTAEKWNHHLSFAKNTFTLADTLWDFENGKSRKGALKSTMTHAQINDFMKQSYEWYNKTFNDTDASLKTRGERESDMNEMARAAYNSAMLKEALACPDATGGQDYSKIYDKEIKEPSKVEEETQDNINFYIDKLSMMGVKFSGNEYDMKKFTDDLNNLITQGVSIGSSPKTKNEITYKTNKNKKDKNGKYLREKKIISSKRYVYNAVMFEDIYRKFIEKYSYKWESWVNGEYLRRGSYGLFNDPKGKIESEFKDLSYECQPSKILKGIDGSDPNYNALYEKKTQECRDKIQADQKKMNNLLQYYVRELKKNVFDNKEAKAKIWTAESWYLGYNRNLSSKQDEITKEEPVCENANQLTQSDSNLLKAKLIESSNTNKEIIAKHLYKRTQLKKEKMEASSKNVDDIKKREDFSNRKNKEDKNDTFNTNAVRPIPFNSKMFIETTQEKK